MSAAPHFADGTVWNLVERRARETPDAPMLVDETGRTLTFREYRDAAERTAAGLAALGVRADSVVSWQLPTWIESVVLVAALTRLGAVQNPLVPIYREREVTFCVQQTGAQLLIVPSTWRGFDYAGMAERVAKAVGGVRVLVVDRALPQGDPATLPPPPPIPASVAAAPVRWIYYTSGSTADPKGAKHTDPGLAAAAIAFLERIELVPEDRVALVFPFTHIGGSNFLISGLLAGCTYICVEIFDPPATVDVLARERVTIAGAGTPFHLAYLDVQRARGREPIFPHLRACNGGGGPKPVGLHLDVKRTLGGIGVVSGYGLTECPVLAMNDLHSDDDAMARSEGPPAPGVDLRIVGPDGAVCAPGVEGEIRAKAPQMLVGYVDPALDADGFDEHGYFRTGDLGYRLPGGHVVVSGRLKDIIIRKGENISAKEVEDLLYEHPKVSEVAVIGLPDPDLGERCCAVVVPRVAAEPLAFDEMVTYLRDRGLMMQKIPEQLAILAQLPRAPAGKVLKQDLKRQLLGAAS
jgi:acyl-CoA synthetase (AMP-forming)/AMP-acid ligase II